ncbi:unnamed protein product [Linum trigynum]|uniref:Uncharacterized protein n=1 Tax=Linum trigynum TaxID=586398 RepID=A0AAV2CX06_9ROSI
MLAKTTPGPSQERVCRSSPLPRKSWQPAERGRWRVTRRRHTGTGRSPGVRMGRPSTMRVDGPSWPKSRSLGRGDKSGRLRQELGQPWAARSWDVRSRVRTMMDFLVELRPIRLDLFDRNRNGLYQFEPNRTLRGSSSGGRPGAGGGHKRGSESPYPPLVTFGTRQGWIGQTLETGQGSEVKSGGHDEYIEGNDGWSFPQPPWGYSGRGSSGGWGFPHYGIGRYGEYN